MKKDFWLILFLALALLAGMLLTALWGRGSRHGYGAIPPVKVPSAFSAACFKELP